MERFRISRDNVRPAAPPRPEPAPRRNLASWPGRMEPHDPPGAPTRPSTTSSTSSSPPGTPARARMRTPSWIAPRGRGPRRTRAAHRCFPAARAEGSSRRRNGSGGAGGQTRWSGGSAAIEGEAWAAGAIRGCGLQRPMGRRRMRPCRPRRPRRARPPGRRPRRRPPTAPTRRRGRASAWSARGPRGSVLGDLAALLRRRGCGLPRRRRQPAPRTTSPHSRPGKLPVGGCRGPRRSRAGGAARRAEGRAHSPRARRRAFGGPILRGSMPEDPGERSRVRRAPARGRRGSRHRSRPPPTRTSPSR